MIGHDPWHVGVEAVFAMPQDCQAGHKLRFEQRVRFHAKHWANLMPLLVKSNIHSIFLRPALFGIEIACALDYEFCC